MKRFGSIVALALGAMTPPAAAQPVGYGQTGLGNAVGTNVEDVRTLHRFSACVAERYPEEARRTLALDFRSRESGRARHALAQQGRGCIRNTARP